MRGGFKCGRIQGVILYIMSELKNITKESQKDAKNDGKVLVATVNTCAELEKLMNDRAIEGIGCSFVKSKKILKTSDFWTTISKNDQKIKVIFIDNEFFDNKNVNFDELNCPKYITITSKTKPRDYEALFYKYSKAGITGINFDIESVTKGHLALCAKFNLTTCAYGITFERQIEKAKELDLNAIQL